MGYYMTSLLNNMYKNY